MTVSTAITGKDPGGRGNLTDQAYEHVRGAILQGDLPVGTILAESSIADQLGISKTPVRQALQLLRTEGLLEVGPRRQLVVREFSVDHRNEILRIREALEEIAVETACRVMSLEEIDVLRLTIMRQRRAADAHAEEAFLVLDEEFHILIAAGAKLPMVARLLEQMRGFARLMRLGRSQPPGASPGHRGRAHADRRCAREPERRRGARGPARAPPPLGLPPRADRGRRSRRGMKIARVDVYGYDLSYVHGRYVMSGGRVIETLPSTVVRVTTEDGVEGFGEVCPLGPAYLPSHGAGARAALGELAPAVVGLSVSSIGAINAAMDRALMGHGYAKSAIDTACWDALGRTVGLPVCDLLGGRVSDTFPLYFAVPLGSVEEMTAYVQARREEGIHRFQLKIGADPYEDAARTRSVVEATGPEDIIVADANGGWRLQDAVVAARAIDGLERVFFEQPCPTLEECLIVRQRTTLPMVLDECIRDVHSLLRAYQANAMEAFNLKISKVGGLTQAKLMRDLAVALGLRVTIEDAWGGDLVTAAVSHLAASTPPDTLFTVSFMNDWTNEHVAGYEPRSQAGFGSAPTRPGLGVDVDVAALGTPLFSI